MTPRVKFVAAVVMAATLAADASARPEKVRAGHSYYSDSEITTDLIRDLVGEKNYEEVYQNYRYYEAVYDAEERVIRFVEYVRGDVVGTETYTYGPDGALVERVVKRPGEPAEVTSPDLPLATPGEPGAE